MDSLAGQITERVPQAPAVAAGTLAPQPSGQVSVVEALRTVMLHTLTDVFALVPEEILWAGYHLDQILAPLAGQQPAKLPAAARQEMLHASYSQALAALESQHLSPTVADSSTRSASLEDWAAVLVSTICECFPMRPMLESTMRGQLTGLLRELGVGAPTRPRSCRYLPSDVRERLNEQAHHAL